MKRSKLLLAFTIMLALFACLLSVPVLSGENPWDADGGNGGGTSSPLDSLSDDAGALSSSPVVTTAENPNRPDDEVPGWLTRNVVRVSTYALSVFNKWTSQLVQEYKFAY